MRRFALWAFAAVIASSPMTMGIPRARTERPNFSVRATQFEIYSPATLLLNARNATTGLRARGIYFEACLNGLISSGLDPDRGLPSGRHLLAGAESCLSEVFSWRTSA
jgi:hypothetical protein